jgi:lysozyme family protein
MAEFNLAVPIVLANEGGYVNDPADPGGETKYGISKRSYPGIDIKNLTVEQATAIYLKDFWKFSGINDQRVADKMFDSYVNLKHTAMKYAQEILFKALTPDGIYGPETEDAVNRTDSITFLTAFRAKLVQHYTDWVVAHPTEQKDLAGLLRRAKQ